MKDITGDFSISMVGPKQKDISLKNRVLNMIIGVCSEMENVRNGAKSPIKKSQSVLKVRFVQYGPYRRLTYKLFF